MLIQGLRRNGGIAVTHWQPQLKKKVGVQNHAPDALSPGKHPIPIV